MMKHNTSIIDHTKIDIQTITPNQQKLEILSDEEITNQFIVEGLEVFYAESIYQTESRSSEQRSVQENLKQITELNSEEVSVKEHQIPEETESRKSEKELPKEHEYESEQQVS